MQQLKVRNRMEVIMPSLSVYTPLEGFSVGQKIMHGLSSLAVSVPTVSLRHFSANPRNISIA